MLEDGNSEDTSRRRDPTNGELKVARSRVVAAEAMRSDLTQDTF